MTTAEETAAEPGAPRPRRADARRNRERVLAAARETFAADGPDASLNEIARRAGVGPGTLYRNFPTRQALQAAVLADRVAHLCGRADELIATVPPAAALAGWLRAFLAHAHSDHGLGGAVLSDPPGLDCHQAILEAAARVLTRAQDAGAARPDVAAADMIQLVVGVALATGRGADSGQGQRLLDLVLDALRTGGASGAGRG
ncbi:TetR/AcrR family transcriptional regulator [Actinomadura algeriensis]|uniref:AcrR family transcriptional regulator n=1 Tax=Actinomadura algeriensis TaxID=1679523 RepID=A0ABR9JYT3_9ACTN|nr:TetR/AcrR family transcriptional regulator [Actinomadura algeriensis]MBE1535732.1 AcrR family transcriptional regulator [Actinomadura algeriensis]